MFTGIVREMGRVARVRLNATGLRLQLRSRLRAREGDSVCVSGVCLSALKSGTGLVFDVVRETLAKTTLGTLAPGDFVNLEPSLTARDPIGGHFVMGHVDGVGVVTRRRAIGDGMEIEFEVDPAIASYLARKGSVAVDGVSLTVVDLGKVRFSVALIPLTLAKTTLGLRGVRSKVNVEVDVLSRYVKRGSRSSLTKDWLRRAGYIL